MAKYDIYIGCSDVDDLLGEGWFCCDSCHDDYDAGYYGLCENAYFVDNKSVLVNVCCRQLERIKNKRIVADMVRRKNAI